VQHCDELAALEGYEAQHGSFPELVRRAYLNLDGGAGPPAD